MTHTIDLQLKDKNNIYEISSLLHYFLWLHRSDLCKNVRLQDVKKEKAFYTLSVESDLQSSEDCFNFAGYCLAYAAQKWNGSIFKDKKPVKASNLLVMESFLLDPPDNLPNVFFEEEFRKNNLYRHFFEKYIKDI